MNFQHRTLALGGWYKLNFLEQMANIGSEVERAINWKNKNNNQYSKEAFYRSLELLFFTIEDKNNISRLKELTRLREVLIDYFCGDNEYNSSDILWKKYFYPFFFAARKDK